MEKQSEHAERVKELREWCQGESLDEDHAILAVVTKDCEVAQIEETLETIKALGRVRRDRSHTRDYYRSAPAGSAPDRAGNVNKDGVGPNMVWRRHVDQLLDASAGQITAQQKPLDVSAGDVTALQEGSDTPQDSEDAPMPPDNAAVNDDTQIPATVNPTTLP
ncbi:hypothetical protein AAFF_G00045630 [Aldrovandia affinis]|uniref:Uncharacterized protein n=1 Tax=Aldrovandia affinis TaxID=143900 RepID=A0AAD7S264_9TELE|nr:hypothetical protein AAFF_G00045630 [Aldrovandia affinis]